MKLVTLMIAVGLMVTVAHAQDSARRPDRPPPGPQGDSQLLSADQKAQVKAILSKYDASALTAKDARAINDAFRSASLTGAGQEAAADTPSSRPSPTGRNSTRSPLTAWPS